MTDTQYPYRMGLIHDHRGPRYPDMATFATETQPTPPPTVEPPSGIQWPMADNDKLGDCLGPETRVLTADLRWVPIRTVKVGDELIGFDEHLVGTAPRRRIHKTVVERVETFTKPCYDLQFEDGTNIRASFDHQWLRRTGRPLGDWIPTSSLVAEGKRPSRLARWIDTWEEEYSYEVGYLAGALDGEGCLAHDSDSGQVKAVQFAQRANVMLSEVIRILDLLGFVYSVRTQPFSSLSDKGYDVVRISDRRQVLRLLGMVRPKRLLDKFDAEKVGSVYSHYLTLTEKKDVGVQEVTALQTSTRTFIAEGIASHNCTIAGACHVNQVGAAIVNFPWTYQGDAATGGTYFGLTGGPDTGLQLPQVLEPWHTTGFWGQGKSGGSVSINPKDTTGCKRGVWIFGNNYIAVNLPAPAQSQFKLNGSGVWELTNTQDDYDIIGGHCIVPVGYNADGMVTVTWGSTVLITWQWWATYVEQVYAVVPPDFVANGGDDRGYNLAAIDAFLPVAA